MIHLLWNIYYLIAYYHEARFSANLGILLLILLYYLYLSYIPGTDNEALNLEIRCQASYKSSKANVSVLIDELHVEERFTDVTLYPTTSCDGSLYWTSNFSVNIKSVCYIWRFVSNIKKKDRSIIIRIISSRVAGTLVCIRCIMVIADY